MTRRGEEDEPQVRRRARYVAGAVAGLGLPAHPFAATLRMHLKERDNEREASHAAFDTWVTEVRRDAKAAEEAQEATKRRTGGG